MPKWEKYFFAKDYTSYWRKTFHKHFWIQYLSSYRVIREVWKVILSSCLIILRRGIRLKIPVMYPRKFTKPKIYFHPLFKNSHSNRLSRKKVSDLGHKWQPITLFVNWKICQVFFFFRKCEVQNLKFVFSRFSWNWKELCQQTDTRRWRRPI